MRKEESSIWRQNVPNFGDTSSELSVVAQKKCVCSLFNGDCNFVSVCANVCVKELLQTDKSFVLAGFIDGQPSFKGWQILQ